MRWPLWLRRRSPDEKRLATYAGSVDARLAGLDRYVYAASAMAMDDLVAEGCKVASAYVLGGSSIENARRLAVLDLSAVIRAQQGWEVTKEFRQRMNEMPVFLLLSPAAHAEAHNHLMRLQAELRRVAAAALPPP